METVAARIYNAVKQHIIEGRHHPGARITEQQLAEQFKSSRTPVREAMRLLVADGFVVFKPNSGTIVREWTPEQIVQLFDARVLIESEIAAVAARHIGDDEVAELMRLQDEIEASAKGMREDMTGIGRLNREFHRVIAHACHNERLIAMLASAMEMPVVQQTFRRYTPQQLHRSFGHHRELIDAFGARDASWAQSVMTCHIHSAKHALLGNTGHRHAP